MDTWQIIGLGVTVIGGLIAHTHIRINQVRQEAIDIADRNQKEVSHAAAIVREELTTRTADLRAQQEQVRRETREDLKDIQEGTEKFRDEIRQKLADLERTILGAIRAPSGHNQGRQQ